jgi:uncharacterized protein
MTMPKRESHIDFVEFPAQSPAAVVQAREFFSNVFGWSYQDWGDDYIDTRDSGLGSGINADPAHRSAQPLIVIYVGDLEAACARVRAAHGKITRAIFAFPGGRRFHFREPSGNELAVWSDR